MTLPLIDSPPIVTFLPTPEQLRFMHFHQRQLVSSWRWLMKETQLRAFNERGHTATLSRYEVAELIDAGLMFKGAGCADVHLTSWGRDACAAKETV
jgi:hypothetical protein